MEKIRISIAVNSFIIGEKKKKKVRLPLKITSTQYYYMIAVYYNLTVQQNIEKKDL